MNRFIGILIAGTHERGRKIGLWVVAFVALLFGATWIVAEQVSLNMRVETQRSLAGFEQLRANVLSTFEEMDRRLVQPACSPAFLDELRRIAFLPDGINELLYAPNGRVECSVNSGRLASPEELGAPDFAFQAPYNMAFWVDVDLGFLRLDGMTGTLAQRGALAMIVPSQPLPATRPRWMEQELIFRFSDDVWLHRQGEAGLYTQARDAAGPALASVFRGVFYEMSCDSGGIHCVASRSYLNQLFALGWATVAVILLLAGVLAAWVAQQLNRIVERYWSFEARFLRRLDAEISPETAQVEIERLRAAGLKVYIDDFGAGYSSMHNLAALSIDGVKLDRSFAMAPDQSVMATMLDHAIDLAQASGRSLVVEGVETMDRLKALRATGIVDFAQGYEISRPLLTEPFIAYLADHGPRPFTQPRLVA